jgi:hypothetical protein
MIEARVAPRGSMSPLTATPVRPFPNPTKRSVRADVAAAPFGAAAMIAAHLLFGPRIALLAVALVSVMIALAGLARARGRPLAASDCYFFSTLVLCGVAPMLSLRAGLFDVGGGHVVALSLMTTQMLVVYVATNARGHDSDSRVREPLGRARALQTSAFLVRLSVLLVATALVARVGSVDTGPIASAAASAAALTFLCGATLAVVARRGLRVHVLHAAAALSAAAYLVFFFDGFGRIGLVALGLSAIVILSRVTRRVPWRLILVLTTLPSLVVAGAIGRARLPDSVAQQSDDAGALTSLGSAMSPVDRFARLMQNRSTLTVDGPQPLGTTFLVSTVVWVPSSAWELKPPGFGRILVDAVGIKGGGPEHSEAAFDLGEWYYAFWYPGVVMGIAAMAAFVVVLDRRIRSTPLIADARTTLRLLVAAFAAGGVADLIWGGSFIFASRMLIRILLVMVLSRLLIRRGWGGAAVVARP